MKKNYKFNGPFTYWTKDIVLELQEDDSSNKVTLLKLILIVTGICVVALPLITMFDKNNSIILSSIFLLNGVIILWLADKFHKFILNYTEIDN